MQSQISIAFETAELLTILRTDLLCVGYYIRVFSQIQV